jgi:cyclophilin family peptidyl-prolyl cis-trans isomerase
MKYLAYLALMLPFVVSEAKPSSSSSENVIVIELKDGPVVIETFPEVAPKHVERIKKLAQSGKYDGVAFHRVIDGFMAQTGDVEFGNVKDFSNSRVGTGGSDLPDLKEEFNDKKHLRGTCSMARSASPNSANSQFFICFEPSSFLDRQYTVWGQVIEGMDFVDKIKMGSSRDNGSVTDPDHMIKVTVGRPAEDKKDSEKK